MLFVVLINPRAVQLLAETTVDSAPRIVLCLQVVPMEAAWKLFNIRCLSKNMLDKTRMDANVDSKTKVKTVQNTYVYTYV